MSLSETRNYEIARSQGDTFVTENFTNIHNGFVDSPIRIISQHVSDKYAEKMIAEAEAKRNLGLDAIIV